MLVMKGSFLLENAARQLAPATLSRVTLMPILARFSWIRRHIGSLVTAAPRSNDKVVSKPSGKPASVRSCFAFARSVLYQCGCGHSGAVTFEGPPNSGRARL